MYAAQFLSGRVALVTGGAGGIGAAVSEALAASGCQVVAADLPNRLGATDTGGGIEHVGLNVTDASDITHCVQGVVQRHGRLDILVNVAGNVAYGVSKAGVHLMTSYLAKELASFGITVNAVAPGPVASAMTTAFPQTLKDLIPVGRMGKASEIASAILFLASPESGFVTGEILDVNGGLWSD